MFFTYEKYLESDQFGYRRKLVERTMSRYVW